MPDKVTLEVFRYDPERPEAGGRFQSFEVPYLPDWTVLDALNHIKDQLDGSVTYRWSCRMGVCGSCGMMVDGEPTLTCGSFLSEHLPGPIRVEPLDHFPVVRDLVVDVQPFVDKLKSVQPWIVRKVEKPVSEGEYLQSPEQLAEFKQFTLCINCMLCYAACPISGIEPDFVGPAALALAHRYNLDSRDEGFKARRDVVFSHSAVWACTYVGECSVVCPKHVDPASAIQQEKLLAAQDWLTSWLPGGELMSTRPPMLHRPHSPLWWTRKRNYVVYVLRELSAVFVALTALGTVFIVHEIRLGPAAWQATLRFAAGSAVGIFTVIALCFALLHSVTFIVAARRALIIRIGGKRVSGDAIVAGHIVGWVLGTVVITWAVLR